MATSSTHDRNDVVTGRKEAGSWSKNEVQGTVIVGIPQGLMGWEGEEAEVTLVAHIRGAALATIKQHTHQAKNDVVTERKEGGSWSKNEVQGAVIVSIPVYHKG